MDTKAGRAFFPEGYFWKGFALLFFSQTAHAASFSWGGTPPSGNWEVNANWSPNTGFPSAAGDVANFGVQGVPTNTFNITATVSKSVGTIETTNTANVGYTVTLSNAVTITMNNSGSGALVQSLAAAGGLSFIGLNGFLALGENTTFNVAGGNITVQTTISGTSALIKQGAGTLFLARANTYSGGTTVSAGILNGSFTGGIQGNITNNAAISFTGFNNENYTGVVSGSGTMNVAVSSNKILTFSNNNTYTGTTTVTTGTLACGVINALSSSTDISVSNGAIFSLAGFSQTIGSIAGAGNVTLGGATLATNGDNASTALSGAITGTGSVTKQGTGTLTLTGTNTYSSGTTVSAGVLQGNTTSLQGAITNNASVVFDQSTTGTYAGIMGGSGAVTKQNSGTVILTGANTYSGGTTVSVGVLQGTTTGLQGAITNNASVVFDQSTTGTYAGIMGGSGAVTKQNSGTVILTGANTYSGGTTVSVGVLQGNTTSLQGAITNNASVVFDQTGSGTYAGIMGGSGSVTKQNSGTVILTGANTYSGGTTVSVGVLQGNTTSLQGAITNNASVVFDQTGSGTYAGIMGGSGSVTKQNSGTVILTGANTYSGGTTVSTGVLQGNTTSLQGAITNNASVVFDQTGSGTYGGIMGGSGSVTKQNSGTLIVTGANTYSGGTTVSVGVLQGNTTSLQGAITNNASVVFDQIGSGTYGGIMGGSGAVTKQNSGTLIVTGANTYSGGTTVSTGVLQGNTTSLQGAITNNASVVFDQTGSGTYAGIMGGSGSVTKQNSGTLIVTGANTYSGGTTVSVGVLQGNTTSLQGAITNNASVVFDQIGSGTYAGIMGGTGAVTKQNSGTVILTGANTYSGGTTVSTGVLQGNTTSLQGAITNNASVVFDQTGSGTYGGIMGGSGSVTKQNSGTVILTGANTYSGGTTVSAGILQGNTTSLQGGITNNASVVFDQAGSGTYGGIMGGTGSLTSQNSGTLTLTGTNTYSGGSTLNGGSVQIASDSNLGDAAGSISFGGGTLELLFAFAGTTTNRSLSVGTSGGTILSDLLSGASATFSGPIGGAGGTFTVNQTNASILTLSGNITSSNSLTKQGVGTLILTGTNGYSGGTTISAGTLQGNTTSLQGAITNNASVVFDQTGSGTYASIMSGTGSLTKQNSGTLILTGTNGYSGGTTVSAGALQGDSTSLQGNITNNASVIFDQIGSGTYAGNMSGTGLLTKQNSGTLIVTGTNVYSGGTTVSAGVLQGNATSLQGAITNNASVVFDQTGSGTYGGIMGGTGSLTKQNSGTLIVTGANAYSGGTTVSAGTLQGNVTSLQGDITNNASVVFDQTGSGTYGSIISGSGSLTKQNSGTLILTGANVYSGGTTVSAGTLQGDVTSLQGSITNNASVVFDQTGSGTYGGIMSGTGSLTKQNSGTLILTGTNGYSGGTTVSAGTLQGNVTSLQGNITNNASVIFDQIGSGTYAGNMSGTGLLTKQNSGTLIVTGTNVYSGGTTVSAGVLQGNATSLQGAITNNASVVFDQTGTGTYAGAMGGTGSLTKQNSGTLIVTGANAYSGGTTVSAGTLQGNVTSLQGDITNNASVVFDQTGSGTYGSIISGSGSLTKQNSGTLILTGANVYSGGTTVSAGTLQGDVTSLQGSITNNASVVFDQTGSGTYASIMSGTGSLTKQNSGTLILTGTNGYSGGTTVSAGALQGDSTSLQGDITNNASVIFDQIGSGTYAGNMSGTGLLTKQNSGTLIVTGTNVYSGGTTVSAGVLQGNATSLQGDITNNTSVIFDQTGSGTYGGIMGGTGSLTKQNSGTLIVTGANAYSGGTTVSAGTLQGNVTSLQGDITNNASVVFDQTGSGTYGSIISGSGSLTKQNSGTLILTGANVYSGGTTVSAGTLQGDVTSLQGSITNNASVVFDQTGSGTYASIMSGTGSLTKQNSGTLILTGTNGYSGGTTVSAGALQGDSTSLQGNITNNASVIFDQIGSGTYAGNMSGTGLLTKQNSGTLIVTGTNVYSGGTTVSAGVLQGNATSLQGDITNNTSVIFDQTGTGTYAGAMGGTGSLTKQNTGVVTLTAVNTYSGGSSFNGGSVQISSDSNLGDISASLSFDGGTLELLSPFSGITSSRSLSVGASGGTILSDLLAGDSAAFTGPIGGAGGAFTVDQANTSTLTLSGNMTSSNSLIKQGIGTLILTGSNTYSGGTTVTAGTLQGDTTSLQGNITNNASVVFDQASPGTYSDVIDGSGSLTKQNSGTLTFTQAHSYSNGTTITDGTLLLSGSGSLANVGVVDVGSSGILDLTSASADQTIGPLSGSGAVSMGANLLTVNSTSSTSYSGALTGTAGFAKMGSATLQLAGPTLFTGNLTIADGVFQLAGSGSIDGSNDVSIATGATFDFSPLPKDPILPSTTTVFVGNVTGGGTLALGSNDLVTTTTAASLFSGMITGSGNLTKEGPAIWQLTGNSSGYLGVATIAAGEINLNGSLGGTLIVSAGATLSGNGSVGDLVSSGTINTGNNNIGIMTVNGSLTMLPGNLTLLDIDPAGNHDLIQVAGTSIIQGEVFVNFLPGIYIRKTTYNVITAASVAGLFSPIVDNNADFDVSISYFPTFVELVLINAPLFLGMDFTNPNAQAVADALEIINAEGDLTGDLKNVMVSLVGQSTQTVQDALDQMQPSQLSAFTELNAEHGFNLLSLMQDRYEMCCRTSCLSCGEHYNFWITPYGEKFDQKPLQYQVGFEAATLGIAIGTQGTIRDTTCGIALAYDQSEVEWHRHRGHGDVSNYYGGAYIYQKMEHFYLGVTALYGHNDYHTSRHIEFTTINRHAKSHFLGNEILAELSLGICLKGVIDTNLYADITYNGSHRNKFKEHGAQSLDLKSNSSTNKTLFYDVGVDFKKNLTYDTVCLTPDLKLGWLQEKPIYRKKYKSHFLSHPDAPFKTRGYNKIQNFFTPGFRLTLDIKNRWSLSLDYNLQISSHFFGQNGFADVKFAF